MLRAPTSLYSFSVQVKDHALVLFLPQVEQHCVWRFDLDLLTEQAFCVTLHDGHYSLGLRNLDGDSKAIARFADKGEAYALLDALHTALTGDTTKTSCSSFSLKRYLRWLTFWRVVFIALILSVAWLLLRPMPLTPLSDPRLPLMLPDTGSALPPGGIPLDADQLLQ